MEEKQPVKECAETTQAVADAFSSYVGAGAVEGSPVAFFNTVGQRTRLCNVGATMGELFAAFAARAAKPESVTRDADARNEFATVEDYLAHQGDVPFGQSAVSVEECYTHFAALGVVTPKRSKREKADA